VPSCLAGAVSQESRTLGRSSWQAIAVFEAEAVFAQTYDKTDEVRSHYRKSENVIAGAPTVPHRNACSDECYADRVGTAVVVGAGSFQ
jgi:hypothetical protein